MSRPPQYAARPRGARAPLLLVLAVLAGLLAMHGLAPAGATEGAAHAIAPASAHGHHTGSDEAAEPSVITDGSCHHHSRDQPGHSEHADSTCAATGISSAPAVPALAPGALSSDADVPASRPAPGSAPGARAPPSLSELQLLRI